MFADRQAEHMTEITDDMCRRAMKAMKPDRIQGFSTPLNKSRTEWGAPHYILDVFQHPEQRMLWSGDSQEEMLERCQIEQMRLALRAAFNR